MQSRTNATTQRQRLLFPSSRRLTADYTVSEITGYLFSEQQLNTSTAQDFDADKLEQFFHFGSSAADPSQPHLAGLRPTTPAAAACEAVHQFTDTAVF